MHAKRPTHPRTDLRQGVGAGSGSARTSMRSAVEGTSPTGLPLLAVLARVALGVAAREIAEAEAPTQRSLIQVATPMVVRATPSKGRSRPADTTGRVA